MARENTFTRRLRERESERHQGAKREDKKSTVVHEQPMTIDDMLAHLEDDVRKLKVEFDIYFNGAAKRPPYDTKGRVDVPTVKGLYDALVRAKVQCGESVDDFSFAQFHRMIAAKTDALKERLGCERVRYSVYLEDGRVSFKAKAER